MTSSRAPLAPGRRLWFAGCALLLLLPCSAWGRTKHSKNAQKVAIDHVAQGVVVNGSKQALDGAVVYLEDPTSLAVKSYLSNGGGHFHFDHLSPQTDYEIWAEQNGVESKHKFISQFNTKQKFNFTLTVAPEKKHKLLGFL